MSVDAVQVYQHPSRNVLIVGAVKAALYGLELRRIVELRRGGVEDWNDDSELRELRRVGAAVYAGEATETRDREILSMLAYTQQTMRVSHEEWEGVVKVSYASQ